jgi:bifunctional non-homologous end joining protein LigD
MNFYKPMLALAAPRAFSDKNWIFEVKWDGFRALAYVNDRFSLQSRNGNEFKYNFPEIAELKNVNPQRRIGWGANHSKRGVT